MIDILPPPQSTKVPDVQHDELILLTGASGYIGGRLRRELEEHGYKLRCVARRPETPEGVVGPNTEVVQADMFDPESLGPALEARSTWCTPWGARAISRSATGKQPETLAGSPGMRESGELST